MSITLHFCPLKSLEILRTGPLRSWNKQMFDIFAWKLT